MKCPNEYCGGKVEQHVKTDGSGSRYCLDGCGYYEEFPAGTVTPPRKEKADAPTAKPKKKYAPR